MWLGEPQENRPALKLCETEENKTNVFITNAAETTDIGRIADIERLIVMLPLNNFRARSDDKTSPDNRLSREALLMAERLWIPETKRILSSVMSNLKFAKDAMKR